jgi:hypothetical protein
MCKKPTLQQLLHTTHSQRLRLFPRPVLHCIPRIKGQSDADHSRLLPLPLPTSRDKRVAAVRVYFAYAYSGNILRQRHHHHRLAHQVPRLN